MSTETLVAPPFERIDLHTHSNCSDGVLTPTALVARAASRRVELLALTDHDTVSGCDEAALACGELGIRFVAGIELSCLWREREIHVVGLNIDPGASAIVSACATALTQRRARITAIGVRLSQAGLAGEVLTHEALAASSPTRAHLARSLCRQGLADTIQDAFDHWLGRGQPGFVSAQWQPLSAAVRAITIAGGTAVLAHPHRYKVSNGVLRELVSQFKAAGGGAIEVSLSGMGPADADRAASLARRFDLAGSIGSDFHEPDLPWRPLGRFAKLPDGIRPITAVLGL